MIPNAATVSSRSDIWVQRNLTGSGVLHVLLMGRGMGMRSKSEGAAGLIEATSNSSSGAASWAEAASATQASRVMVAAGILVRNWHLPGLVHHKHFHGSLLRFQLEPELILNGRENRRRRR